jgi:chromosome segregation ATPase
MSSNRMREIKDVLANLSQAHTALEQDLKKHEGDTRTSETVLQSYKQMIHDIEKQIAVQVKSLLGMERPHKT